MSRKVWLGLLPIAALLLSQFFSFDVLQDDAFISFRYIRNFLAGHGLVFNIGERVEGYTNFFWIILLAFLTKLGLPLIETARFLGVLAGIGTVFMAAYTAYRLYPKRNWVWILSVPTLLAANGALAYWAGSGLETGLFTFLAAAAAVTYFSRLALSLLLLALATLTRPEGALLAFLFGASGILLKQKSWKGTLTFWGGLALLLLPFAVFKWLYYGSLFPNPFYAKTGFSTEYWKSGMEYSFMFLKHYGLSGAALLLPLILWKKLAVFSQFSLLVFLGYSLYVAAVGGDVLPAHRFFVPILTLFYLPFADVLSLVLRKSKFRDPVFGTSMLLLGFIFYWLPSSYLHTTASMDRQLTFKMTVYAHFFATYTTAKCFAITAAGALPYHLMDRRFVDMVGLTDPVVAKNPAKIDGLISTVKERSYNARYVLAQKPDIILFNTGVKPTSLPERALFLYPDFRRNYRLEFAYPEGNFLMYYRRFQDRPTASHPDMPAQFANLFNEALNFVLGSREFEKGIPLLRQLLEQGPEDCPTFYTMLGYAYLTDGSSPPESAYFYLKKGMELDRGGTVSQLYLVNFFLKQKDYAAAFEQLSILTRTVPNADELFRRRKPNSESRL